MYTTNMQSHRHPSVNGLTSGLEEPTAASSIELEKKNASSTLLLDKNSDETFHKEIKSLLSYFKKPKALGENNYSKSISESQQFEQKNEKINGLRVNEVHKKKTVDFNVGAKTRIMMSKLRYDREMVRMEQYYNDNKLKFNFLRGEKRRGETKEKNKRFKSSSKMLKKKTVDLSNANTTTINKLPYDCLEQIFVCLSVEERLKMRRVCKKWREANEFVWSNVKKLVYKNEWPKCRDPGNEELCYCFKSLNDLKLEFCYLPNLFVLCGRYVQELDISKLCNSIVLSAIRDRFPNLMKLTIRIDEYKDEHITNLFNGMTKLEYLNVQWHHYNIVPLSFFEALNDVVETLKEFHLWNMRSHIDPEIEYNIYHLENSCLPTIRRLQSLHTLNLAYFKMDKETIEAISQLKNLNKLNLYSCPVEHISMAYPLLDLINLKSINPGICHNNYDRFLMEIPDKLKNLTEFSMHVAELTDVGVLALTKLEKLEVIALINLYGLSHITDASIKKFKNMQKVYFENFPKITDDSIIDILKYSPNLNLIDLEKTGITFEIVDHVIDNVRNRSHNTRLSAIFDLPNNLTRRQMIRISRFNLNITFTQKLPN